MSQSAPTPDLPTLVLGDDDPFEAIGREVLPGYLPRRRWFAAKTETLVGADLAYAMSAPGASDVFLAEITARLPGREERYVLPLAIVWDGDAPNDLAQTLALARVRRHGRAGLLTDGFAVDGFATGILALLHGAARLDLPGGGVLEFRPTARLPASRGGSIRTLSAEQSNSSLIVDDAVVLKIVRRTSAGIHPEGEMTRLLTERGFGNIAPLFGEVVRHDPDGAPSTLMLAQAFVRNQGDGWAWTLDALASASADVPPTVLDFAGNLGRRLAEMHAVLAAPTDDTAFAPDVADDAILDGWARSAAEQIALACEVLQARDAGPLARRIVASQTNLVDAVQALAQAGRGAIQTRIHGDFHLGQVLVVDGDAVIIDFEGEPARPLAQRRAKSCGLRDVAGLLRSFDYAAATAAQGAEAASPTMLDHFRSESAARALDAYRAVLHAATTPWVPRPAEAALLDLFLIEKAAYEIRYEAENRPTWLPIPLAGLTAIAERVGALDGAPPLETSR